MKKKLLFSVLLLIFGATFGQGGFLFSGNVQSRPIATSAHPGQGHGTYHTSAGNAGYGMPAAEFNHAKRTIEIQRFDEDRLRVARQIFRENVMISAQVREIMELFRFEDSRLNFAKFAFQRTLDTQNYFIVNQAFSFSSSVRELDRFIRNNPISPHGTCGVHGAGCNLQVCNSGNSGYDNGYGQGYADPDGQIGVYHSGGGGQSGYGCATPAPMVMDPARFEHLKAAICRQPFSSDKLILAKQGIRDQFITADMVRQITALFTFESSKLEFAKYAYAFTIDPQNYYVVNDAFTFSSSIRELDTFLFNR